MGLGTDRRTFAAINAAMKKSCLSMISRRKALCGQMGGCYA
jgi:hypothetical protein